jgi:hypothetical protein
MAFLDFIFEILFERTTLFLRSFLISLGSIPRRLRRAVVSRRSPSDGPPPGQRRLPQISTTTCRGLLGGPRSPSAGIDCTVARRSTATSEMPHCLRQGSLRAKRRRQFFGLLPGLLLLIVVGMGEAQAQSKEYQLKAAFLFNFAQFVQWPAASFTDGDAPFCIGILGEDPFGAALEETIQGETINNRRLRVQRGRNFEDLQGCQLIFVSKSEEGHLAEIFSKLDSKPILTVSDIDSFAQNGGVIDFYLQEGKVRFEINPDSAHRVGLRVSSQLLNLGKIIGPAKEGN